MKKMVRLTESELHRIIKESVNRVLNEIGDTPNGQYALGKLAQRQLHRDKNPKAAFKTMWKAGDNNIEGNNNKSNAYKDGKSSGQKEFMK
jgi:hypothetical protein